jgi:hypothetical protein
MQARISIGIIAVALLAAGGWVWYERTHTPSTVAPLQEEFDWSFVGTTSGVASTTVSLKIAGVEVPLGTYTGDCFSVAGSEADLLPNELSGAICLSNGTGEEIGIFQEGTGLTLMQGQVTGESTSTLSRTGFVALKKQP